MPGKYYATSVIPETKWIENDLPAAIAQAKKENKQIFIDFTGYTCVNCRRMENDIFPKPEVREAFGKYVLLKLYTDDIINNPDRSMEYQELQTKLVGAISLPYYVIVDTDLKPLYKQKDWEPDASKFVAFLKQDAKYKVASK
jgi:thiol:disulfide interchange protein